MDATMRARREEPGERPQALFIVGNSRSGTTLMGQILGSHDLVFTFREVHFFERLWTDSQAGRVLHPDEAVDMAARVMNTQRRSYFHGPKDFSPFLEEARTMLGECPEGFTALDVFREFLYYEAARNGASIPCQQTPRDVYYLREIIDTFPAARIVIMVRDPRAVLLSQKRKWRRRQLGDSKIRRIEQARLMFNYHPVVTSRLWNAAIRAGRTFADDPRVSTIRFEDLAVDPEGTVRHLCASIGLDFQPAMLAVPQGSSSNEPDSDDLGIKAKRADAWRQGGLSDSEVFLCERITLSCMRSFGYEPTGARPNLFILVGLLLRLPFQLVGTLILNRSRVRSVVSAVRRRLTSR